MKTNELVITNLNCDLEVDNIMRYITNTYQFMQGQPISPVTSEPPVNDAMNNELFIETATAVAGIEKRNEAIEEMSETVIEVAEFGVITNELDEIIEGVVQDQRQEDMEMLKRTVKRAEKMKRQGEDMEILERTVKRAEKRKRGAVRYR